jgi:hypothetical protein
MSASQRTNPPAIPQSNASAMTQSQLNYDNILELLNKGLVDFIVCFAENDERNNKFKLAFASSLINELDKKNFNQSGTSIIKAAYPDILKLSLPEKDILQKMGILSAQSIETSIDQFFKRALITQFIAVEVKEIYRSDITHLVDTIYKFIGTATCSLEYEQTLMKYDTKHQLIIDKNNQSAFYSGLDLQFATATNNLKLSASALLELKTRANLLGLKTKTSKGKEITDSLAKMHAAFSQALAVYGRNLAEQKATHLRKESKGMALVADAAAMELNQTKAAMQAIQAELEEVRPSIMATLKTKTNDFTPRTSSNSSAAAANGSLDLTQQYQAEEEHKHSEATRVQQRLMVSNEMILEDAISAKVDIKSLSFTFNYLLSQLATPASTEASLLRGLIQWEKAALSYIANHTSTASTSTAIARKLPTSLVAALSFIGQKAGVGKMKTVQPELASALKKELHQILLQCILLTEQDRNFIDCVKALNQHYSNIASNHAADTLEQGTVSNQLRQIVEVITLVAKQRFKYEPAPSSKPPGGMNI